MERRERFYLGVGLAGLAALVLSGVLRQATLTTAGLLVHLVSAGAIVAWSAAGVGGTRRARREAQGRTAKLPRIAGATARDVAARSEAQEAVRRAARQVNAQRTVSHAGMTINVRRRGAEAGRPHDQ